MQSLELADTTIKYAVAGAGAPVLLIQGVGLAGQGWQPQVEGLRGEFSLLSFDHRGIDGNLDGTSNLTIGQMAEDVVALLDAVGWESAHIVGHSMGGLVAQELALTQPKRVRSLALLCTFSRGIEGAGMTPWMMWTGMRSRLGTARMRRSAFLEIVVPMDQLRVVDREQLAAELAPLFGHDLAHQPAVVMRQIRAMARHDRRRRLSELASIATLVVSGRHDKLALPKYGRRLAAEIPGASFVEIVDAAHGAPITRKDVVNELLRQHFRGRRPS